MDVVQKWNESGFRPPLCTYRLNWARRTSWGWRDDWDDTVLQTQDSKFEPWRSEAEHATSRSRRLPTILTFTRGWGRNNFVSFKPPRPGTEPRTLAWKAAVLTTTPGTITRTSNAVEGLAAACSWRLTNYYCETWSHGKREGKAKKSSRKEAVIWKKNPRLLICWGLRKEKAKQEKKPQRSRYKDEIPDFLFWYTQFYSMDIFTS